MMCTLCDELRNKKAGTVDIDNCLINSRPAVMWIEKKRGDIHLMVSVGDALLFAEPIDYCPKCGKRMTLVEDGTGPEPEHEDWAIRHGYF